MLYAYAAQLTRVLQQTGAILRARQCSSLGAFCMEVCQAGKAATGGSAMPAEERVGDSDGAATTASTPSANTLVRALASAFPAFADACQHKYGVQQTTASIAVYGKSADTKHTHTHPRGSTVYFLKNAQLLAADLHRRFRVRRQAALPYLTLPSPPLTMHHSPPLTSQHDGEVTYFNFGDVHKLTAFADNVVPTVLRKQGVITLEADLAGVVDSGTPIPPGAHSQRPWLPNPVCQHLHWAHTHKWCCAVLPQGKQSVEFEPQRWWQWRSWSRLPMQAATPQLALPLR